jgi:hypothetical protein
MPKKGFIRVLWGVNDECDPFYVKGDPSHDAMLARGKRLMVDVELPRHNRFNPPFVAYVFGRASYEKLTSMGYDCRLADERPVVCDDASENQVSVNGGTGQYRHANSCNRGKHEQYGHKFLAFSLASAEFDEFVSLDWDVVPVAPVPDDFWDVLGKKQPIQAALLKYGVSRACWRPRRRGRMFLPSAAFVYIRDRRIASGLVELWREMGMPSKEETVMAAYMDRLAGGWFGVEKYHELFQPEFFKLVLGNGLSSSYVRTNLALNRECFEHIGMRYVCKTFMVPQKRSSMPSWWKGDCLIPE